MLVKHTTEVLKQSQLDTFYFNQQNQHGNTFGEKLSNAFANVFALGYENVIAVGNDTPDLNSVNWQQCVQQLKENKCVIGPTTKGGTYLIGLNSSSFRSHDFENLAWQSNGLFTDLSANYLSSNQVSLLPVLRELNTLSDVHSYIRETTNFNKKIKYLLFRIIRSAKRYFDNFQHSFYKFCSSLSSLRGPPELKIISLQIGRLQITD